MSKTFKFSVFGQEVDVVRTQGIWQCYYCGNEGKKRIARDIHVPDDIGEKDLIEYLADLCHEWASARYQNVELIETRG